MTIEEKSTSLFETPNKSTNYSIINHTKTDVGSSEYTSSSYLSSNDRSISSSDSSW